MKKITHIGFSVMADTFTLGINIINNEWGFAISFLCFEMALFKDYSRRWKNDKI